MRRLLFLVAPLAVIAAACSGNDEPSTTPAPQADGSTSEAGATGADADATTTAGDASDGSTNVSETGDASVGSDGDSSVTPNEAEAAAPDANSPDRSMESGSAIEAGDAAGSLEAAAESGAAAEAGADAPADATAEAAADAPLDVDVSNGSVILLAGGASSVFAAEFHPTTGWSTSTLTGATDDRPAVALTTSSSGIGVIHSNVGDALAFTTWSPGRFEALSAIGNGATTNGSPAIVTSAGGVDLAYQGLDLKHYFARHAADWSPIGEGIGAGIEQSQGPTPPAIAHLGDDTLIAFADFAGLLADRARVGGAWQAAHVADPGAAGDKAAVTPTIVAPASGPELMIAFVRSPGQEVCFTTRTTGVWSVPQAVSGAFSADPVVLLPLPGGDVILVLRSNEHGYWARYSGGVWSAVNGFPWFDIVITSTPSLAPGVTGADAEIAFIDESTGSVMHGRLSGNTWGSLNTVGGSGLTSVSIASAP